MNKIKLLSFITFLSLNYDSYGEAMPVSSGSTYYLNSKEVSDFEKKAYKGDLDAALKLYKHYTFSSYDEKKSSLWLREAAKLGDATSQYNYSSFLLEKNDLKMAEYWAIKANKNGHYDAKDLLGEIGELKSKKK